ADRTSPAAARVTAIAWIATTPTPVPTPMPTATPTPVSARLRACRADDLTVAVGGTSAATNGQLFTSLGFANHSDTPCVLAGYPTLRLLDAEGRPVPAIFVPT